MREEEEEDAGEPEKKLVEVESAARNIHGADQSAKLPRCLVACVVDISQIYLRLNLDWQSSFIGCVMSSKNKIQKELYYLNLNKHSTSFS